MILPPRSQKHPASQEQGVWQAGMRGHCGNSAPHLMLAPDPGIQPPEMLIEQQDLNDAGWVGGDQARATHGSTSFPVGLPSLPPHQRPSLSRREPASGRAWKTAEWEGLATLGPSASLCWEDRLRARRKGAANLMQRKSRPSAQVLHGTSRLALQTGLLLLAAFPDLLSRNVRGCSYGTQFGKC